MFVLKLPAVKTALLDAGFEIFRAKDDTIELAERVRSHLMDAGVRVRLEDVPVVLLTVRAQLSDFPSAGADVLFAKVRDAVEPEALSRGFSEARRAHRDLFDPGDDTRVLDRWYEVTYGKRCADVAALVTEVAWALSVAKCVNP